MLILASRLLGASLAFSGYRGAPIAAWVSPWSKPYASTDIKKKKKKKKHMLMRKQIHTVSNSLDISSVVRNNVAAKENRLSLLYWNSLSYFPQQ